MLDCLPISYFPNFILNPDLAFQKLEQELDWERRNDAPRCEYYCNDYKKLYIYGKGKGRRAYDPRPYHPTILEIRKHLEQLTDVKFETCFLNCYLDQKDHLGWHADDSPEMDNNRPIAIISLGVEREIWFRPKIFATEQRSGDERRWRQRVSPDRRSADEREHQTLLLEHGSLCIMAANMQNTWEHRIPKASFACGKRISLTFRGYVNDQLSNR